MKFGNFNFANFRTIFQPAKMQDFLEEMFTEKRNAEHDGSEMESNESETSSNASDIESNSSETESILSEMESNASETDSNHMNADPEIGVTESEKNRNPMQKRIAKSSSSNGPPVKKIRNENEMDNILDTMENSFKNYVEREARSVKHAIGWHLQNNLDRTNHEKNALKQTIDALNIEKRELERDNFVLKEDQLNEKKKADDEKMALEERIADLKETHRKEKKDLEEKNAVLEHKKTEIACAHCQKVLQPVLFCDIECGK